METDGARKFMSGSSDSWADLSIVAGTPEAAARAAAARTTSFSAPRRPTEGAKRGNDSTGEEGLPRPDSGALMG